MKVTIYNKELTVIRKDNITNGINYMLEGKRGGSHYLFYYDTGKSLLVSMGGASSKKEWVSKSFIKFSPKESPQSFC